MLFIENARIITGEPGEVITGGRILIEGNLIAAVGANLTTCIDRGQYTFIVAPRSNKTEIKQAVEAIFGVKVESVNTQNRRGKTRRTRTGIGKSKDTKRAIVTLREGTIDIFGDATK